MIQVALCDDNKKFLKELRDLILQWNQQEKSQPVMSIRLYSDSEYFLSSLREKPVDLVFLDIEMPKRSGMEVAKELSSRSPHSLIIFLTSHSEFMEEGYQVRAFRYLNKMTVKEKLSGVLSAACQEIRKLDARCLSVQRYSDLIRIPFQELVYVRHVLRYSEITLASGEKIKDHRSLKELLAQLEGGQFIQIDRGAFVNLDYVRQIKANRVILSTGESLAISRQKLPIVRDTISRTWGRTL